MSWRIYRYIIREILPYFLLTLLVVTALIFASEVGRFSELFVKRNVPPALVRTLLATVLTRILIITLPMSLLMGVLLGLTRLSSDNEIVSLFSSGLSRKQLLMPLLSLSALVSLLLGVLTLVELPRSTTRLREIRGQLILQGIRTQVKPRVFDSRFVNRVLYIRDIDRSTDRWEGIFLASLDPGQPFLITGRSGILELGDQPESSKLHVFDGVAHRIEREKEGAEIYHLEGFSSYHVRFDPQSKEAATFQLEAQRQPEAVQEKALSELLAVSPSKGKQYIKARIEAGRRMALPVACLLFAPLGLAFGVLQRPAGRAAGFVISLALATSYYLLLFAGEKLARAGLLPPLAAMWLANLTFAALGTLGLRERRLWGGWQRVFTATTTKWQRLRDRLQRRQRQPRTGEMPGVRRWIPWIKLMDQCLVTAFLGYFGLCLLSLWFIFMVFTLFELSPDILEHQIRVVDVARYFTFLSPQVVQSLAPPCVLIASLVAIGILMRTNQIAILRASGVSSYRLALPILFVCMSLVVISCAWQNWVVPGANERQDRLRFYIKKGRLPTSLELSPMLQEGNWIFGEQARIFHFDQFDRENNQFHHLWIIDLDETNMTIRRRVQAQQAVWEPEKSRWMLVKARVWVFEGTHLVSNNLFEQLGLKLEETPAYFKQDIKKPEYMGWSELKRHIAGLEKSGFDVTEFRIDLVRKIAVPVACLVMGLVGVPFGYTLGQRGALYGVGLGIFLGLVYWIGLGFFEQLGKYGYVNPALAGWGPDGLFGVLGVYVLFRVRT